MNNIDLRKEYKCFQKWSNYSLLFYLFRIISLGIASKFISSPMLMWQVLLVSQLILTLYRLRIPFYLEITSEWWSMLG